MAEDPVNPFVLTKQEKVAGGDYLAALRVLGLEPQVLCWIVEKHGEEWQKRLALVTSLVDRMGQVLLYDLLFKAYDAAATPKEIDPFIVELFSPHSHGGRVLYTQTAQDVMGRVDAIDDPLERPRLMMLSGHFPATFIQALEGGVYVSQQRMLSAAEDLRKGRLFQRHVEELAA